MLRTHLFLSMSALALLLSACADDTPGAGGHNGFTACGSFPDGPKQCQPGQYCENEGFSTCSTGCLSNVNCASDQVCDLNSGSPGICVNTSTTTTQPATCTGECARCEASCDTLFGCGDLDAQGVAGCKYACGTTDAAVIKALSDCVDAAGACGATMTSCMGGGFQPPTTPPTTPPTDPPANTALAGAIAGCKEDCDAYNFFACFEPGELDSCRAACEQETQGNLEGFNNCNGATSCEQSCFDFLTKMVFAPVTPVTPPSLQPTCEGTCSDGGFFECSPDGMTPALTPTEVATCTSHCATSTDAAIEAMANCWDAAFLSACPAGNTSAARACFNGWL